MMAKILQFLLELPDIRMPAEDRAIIEAELRSEASRAYWDSGEFEERWTELQRRFERGTTMTMQGAAEFLNVPFAVLRWRMAHENASEQLRPRGTD
jgi:hypothetical protein